MKTVSVVCTYTQRTGAKVAVMHFAAESRCFGLTPGCRDSCHQKSDNTQQPGRLVFTETHAMRQDSVILVCVIQTAVQSMRVWCLHAAPLLQLMKLSSQSCRPPFNMSGSAGVCVVVLCVSTHQAHLSFDVSPLDLYRAIYS